MCTISDVVQVTFPKATPIVLKHVMRDGDSKFFKCAKSDATFARLLTGHSIGDTRWTARTNIIEALTLARNSKRELLLQGAAAVASADPAEDLGIHAPEPSRKRLRRFEGVLPKVVTIDAPSV